MAGNERRLARATLATDPRFLRAGALFTREMAIAAGLPERVAANLELAAEEAGLLIIDQSFEGQRTGSFDIICEYRDGRFIAAFEDQGLPFEWGKAAQSDTSRHSVALLSGFADELRMINLGRDGKRLEFVVHQSSPFLESSFREGEGEDDPEAVDIAPLDTPLELRPADPERDGVAFARCMYKVYGLTYSETVYFPDRVRSLVEKGLLMSFVAVTADGEVVGHQGVKLDSPMARVANSCMGAVDPRYRGRRLFERLKDMALDRLRQQGLLGVHSEAVTLHPFSQKANFKAGGRETGMLLGHIPRGFSFKDIKDGDIIGEDRQTAVLFYNVLNPPPRRSVHLPARHRQMIERIYSWAGIDRNTATPETGAISALPEVARIDVDMLPAQGSSVIKVIEPGRNFASLLRTQRDELKTGKIEVIYLDIALHWPATPDLVQQAEELGFSFCGIYPEKHEDGDLLRLHYLNNLRINPTRIVTINEMGKDLLDYTLAESKRVQAQA
jgi:anti-sigma regulatory factor (Ser/Thr protein kinase)/GNAT superfamily N-acetyltransferase